MITWLDAHHHFIIAEGATDWHHSARESFAHGHNVGLDAFPMVGHELASTSETGLDLICNEEYIVLGAKFSHLLQVSCFRNDDTSLTLDALKHYTAYVLAVWCFQELLNSIDVFEGNEWESRCERSEPLVSLGIIASSRRGDSASPEVSLHENDFSLVLGDSLLCVAPLPSHFDRGLGGFDSCVHRQELVVAHGLAQILATLTHLVIVERSRSVCDSLGLVHESLQDLGVAMALVVG